MSEQPFVSHMDDYAWEQRETTPTALRWRRLIDRDQTDTHGFSLGVLEFPPGAVLKPHSHAEQEVYLVKQGSGSVVLGNKEIEVKEGSVVYIPEGCRHGMTNTGNGALQLVWVFPTDRWTDVEYVFE